MVYAIHIGLGLALSFIGSLPFGTINMTTAETAIQKGLRAAVWVALGAALVEFFQATLSLKFSSFLSQNALVDQILMWGSIPVFFTLGLYFFLKRNTENKAEPDQKSHRLGFLKGIIVSALNFLAIPYWVFYATYLSSNGWIQVENALCILLFGLGVVSGTFLVLLGYAKLGQIVKTHTRKIHMYASTSVGALFLVLAIWQFTRIAF